MIYSYTASSEDYQTTTAEDSILKKEQDRILVFGIISVGLVAIFLAAAVVILVILLIRKKQLYTINNQYPLNDIMFRHPLSTTSTDHDSVEENKVPKVPIYEEILLQNASEWNQYEKVDTSRCPAYEASGITD